MILVILAHGAEQVVVSERDMTHLSRFYSRKYIGRTQAVTRAGACRLGTIECVLFLPADTDTRWFDINIYIYIHRSKNNIVRD